MDTLSDISYKAVKYSLLGNREQATLCLLPEA